MLRFGLAMGHTVSQLFISCVQCPIDFMDFHPRDLSPKVFGSNVFAIKVEIQSFIVKMKTLNPLKIFCPTHHVILL